jgi:D-glycero-alpha-D-manno-heptose-7-phosphate kinase
VFGGINKFTFKKNEKVIVRKIKLKTKVLNSLNNNLFLVWSKKQRKADSILQSQNKNFRYNLANLNKINHQTKKLINIFQNDYNLSSFSKIINENWENKIKLSKKIFNKQLKILSHKIMLSGATGLKILGAGGGGFFLVIVPNKNKNFFLHQMSKYKIVNFKLESNGTQVILKR